MTSGQIWWDSQWAGPGNVCGHAWGGPRPKAVYSDGCPGPIHSYG